MPPSLTPTLHKLSPRPPRRAKSTPTLWLRSLLSNCSSLSSIMPLPPLRPHQQSLRNERKKPRIATPALLASLPDTQSQCPVAMQPPLVCRSSHLLTPHPSSFDTSPWMRTVKQSVQQWQNSENTFLVMIHNIIMIIMRQNRCSFMFIFEISTTSENSLDINAVIILWFEWNSSSPCSQS